MSEPVIIDQERRTVTGPALTQTGTDGVTRVVLLDEPAVPPIEIDWDYLDAMDRATSPEERRRLMDEHTPWVSEEFRDFVAEFLDGEPTC